jgi:hypothetical protein
LLSKIELLFSFYNQTIQKPPTFRIGVMLHKTRKIILNTDK